MPAWVETLAVLIGDFLVGHGMRNRTLISSLRII
jgi:hypothetical protein